MREKKITVDFHAHILPGADHGSDSVETSLAQLRLLDEAGVSTVVATPHFYPQRDSTESFLVRREGCMEALLERAEGNRPIVCAGAEVLVCPGIDHMPGLKSLCVEGTDVILLEMPFHPWGEEHIEAVRKIARSGLTVVMAHIDRYPLSQIQRLCDECDVLYQINGETQKTLKGRRKVKELCSFLPVVAAGSDIHGADKKAPKRLCALTEAMEKMGLETVSTSEALLKTAKKY